ncbi:hypothetical protein DMENIID0001_057520 [Sergentomyia squamirostris]
MASRIQSVEPRPYNLRRSNGKALLNHAPTYDLSRFLIKILRPATDFGGYNVRNSLEFVGRIKMIEVPEDYIS